MPFNRAARFTARSGGFGATSGVIFTSPLDKAGCYAWYDFSDATQLFTDSDLTTSVSVDGDVIGGCKDKSTRANHIIQATAANKLTYKTAIQNSKSIGRADGLNDELAKSSPTGLPTGDGAGTLFWAGTWSGTGAQFAVPFHTGNTDIKTGMAFSRAGSGDERHGISDQNSGVNSTTLMSSTFRTMIGTYAGNQGLWRIYINGVQEGSNTFGYAITWGAVKIGLGNNNGFSQNWGGDFGEAGAYDSELSAEEVTALHKYLKDRWAL